MFPRPINKTPKIPIKTAVNAIDSLLNPEFSISFAIDKMIGINILIATAITAIAPTSLIMFVPKLLMSAAKVPVCCAWLAASPAPAAFATPGILSKKPVITFSNPTFRRAAPAALAIPINKAGPNISTTSLSK